MNWTEWIDKEVKSKKIVLFMKGKRFIPVCHFSLQVVEILDELGADYVDINVLDDEELRQAIKDYSNWPTLPQLYVNGKFIGGCDIVKELHKQKKLERCLKTPLKKK